MNDHEPTCCTREEQTCPLHSRLVIAEPSSNDHPLPSSTFRTIGSRCGGSTCCISRDSFVSVIGRCPVFCILPAAFQARAPGPL